MILNQQINIPVLLRIKQGALDRLGVYLERNGHEKVLLISSQGLPSTFLHRIRAGFEKHGIEMTGDWIVNEASFETAQRMFADLPPSTQVIIAVGGGKAIDVAKYVAFLGKRPFCAAPTSLSNDGFCSPQSSLTVRGKRRSLPSMIPSAVIIDTEACLSAPHVLWSSGVGDLVAKLTAVEDWKIAFRETGTPLNDFAALLCQATVLQFMARPKRDEKGIRLLGTAFTVTGVAMEICGSSRPASGSEHLISHALDSGASKRPRLHGLQVGVATYLISLLQGQGTEEITRVLDESNFWSVIEADPFERAEWLEAVRMAPSIKHNFHTVLSSRDCLAEIEHHLNEDDRLRRCFVS